MRRFNPDRELYKIKYGKRDKIVLSIIFLLVISLIGSTYALYQVRHSKRIIYTTVSDFSRDIELAVYVNGNKQDSFPTKQEGVVYSETICDKKGITTANWNSEEWKIDIVSTGPNKCKVYFNEGKEFSYTGGSQQYKVPKSGTYKLEVWGAQGGSTYGGKGGYATGNITLTQNQTLYIVVGEQGNTREGGYNGGGNPDMLYTYGVNTTSMVQGVTYGGGGATHIALVDGELKNLSTQQSQILIVAGGGGGGTVEFAQSKRQIEEQYYSYKQGRVYGGAGGGEEGLKGLSSSEGGAGDLSGYPGNQSSGGQCASGSNIDVCSGFGFGGSNGNTTYGGAGGGAGWYGGSNSTRGHAGGGGGSGHLGSSLTDGRMETGIREGNGFVRITYIGS